VRAVKSTTVQLSTERSNSEWQTNSTHLAMVPWKERQNEVGLSNLHRPPYTFEMQPAGLSILPYRYSNLLPRKGESKTRRVHYSWHP
jgi:hypothetical protein